MNNVAEKVKEIVSNHLGVEPGEITDGSYLQDDLNADTLALADIVVALEEEFKISVPQEDFLKWTTVGDITTYIADHLNELT